MASGVVANLETEIPTMLDMPPEVLSRIFQFLSEYEDLIYCGNVCGSWAQVVERMHPRSIWTPWFSYQSSTEAFQRLRETPGTLLECVGDINNIEAEIAKRPSETKDKNPFKQYTLIVKWKSSTLFTELQDELPLFLEKRGQHVRRLLFEVHRDTPQSIRNIGEVLNKLNNLQSLSLFAHDWAVPGILNVLRSLHFARYPNLPQLFELEVIGYNNQEIVGRLITRYVAQLQNIYLGKGCHPRGIILNRCINLVNLKIYGDVFLFSTFQELPLKRLSIYAKVMYENIYGLINAVKSTLESLCLHVNTSAMGPGELANLSNSFPLVLGLKEFALPLSETGHMFFQPVINKFPNLTSLVLLDTKDEFKNKEVGIAELTTVCESVWPKVPPSVEKICIQSRRRNEDLRKYIPTLWIVERSGNSEEV